MYSKIGIGTNFIKNEAGLEGTPITYENNFDIKQQKIEEMAASYHQLSLRYNNQGFTQKIERLIKSMSHAVYTNAQFSFIRKYPIKKILTVLCKKLFMNGLQMLFLQHIINKTKWNVKDEIIVQNYCEVNCFLNDMDVSDQKQFKCLLFYLTLSSYSAKFFLNNASCVAVFYQEIYELVNNFHFYFKSWIQRNSDAFSNITPKILNTIYKQLTSEQEKSNYFMIVESIIEISPPYSSGGEKKEVKKKYECSMTSEKFCEVKQGKVENNSEFHLQLEWLSHFEFLDKKKQKARLENPNKVNNAAKKEKQTVI